MIKLIQVNEITADRYSRIAKQLKLKGTPIPTNDIWIAAQTMEHGAELITSDRHFEKIDGLAYSILEGEDYSESIFKTIMLQMPWQSLLLEES